MMLVWCMMVCGGLVVPSEGLVQWWCGMNYSVVEMQRCGVLG